MRRSSSSRSPGWPRTARACSWAWCSPRSPRPLAGGSTGELRAFESAQPVFVPDATEESAVSRELHDVGARSCLFQPVVRDGRSIGVLVVAWNRPVHALPERMPSLLVLLAAEAAVAIERADLLARLETVARTDD